MFSLKRFLLASVLLLGALSSAYAGPARKTITRPSNTTTYTANTAWANATSGATYTSFSVACPGSGQLLIPQIDISVDENPSTKLQGILWLLKEAPTALNDNATFVIGTSDINNITGNKEGFAFTLVNNGASGATYSGITLAGTTYMAQCSGQTLYGMVQVVNAYVPTSGEIMTIDLHYIPVN